MFVREEIQWIFQPLSPNHHHCSGQLSSAVWHLVINITLSMFIISSKIIQVKLPWADYFISFLIPVMSPATPTLSLKWHYSGALDQWECSIERSWPMRERHCALGPPLVTWLGPSLESVTALYTALWDSRVAVLTIFLDFLDYSMAFKGFWGLS